MNPWKTLLNGIAANQIQIATPNSVEKINSNLRPIFIHESTTTTTTVPSTTTVSSTTPSSTTTKTTPRTTTTSTTPRTTTTSTTPSTTTTETIRTTPKISTTTRPKPRITTTPTPRLGFGANLLRTLFGENIFGTTTPTPVRNARPATTNKRPSTTAKPVSSSTQASVQAIPEVQLSREIVNGNLEALSNSGFGANNPNAKFTQDLSSTFSPQEDAKFLMALLNAAQVTGNKSFLFL